MTPGDIIKAQLLVLDLLRGPKLFISSKLPGDIDAAGLWTTLSVADEGIS